MKITVDLTIQDIRFLILPTAYFQLNLGYASA